MAENVVETILVKLGLDAGDYKKEADAVKKRADAVADSIASMDGASEESRKEIKSLGKELEALADYYDELQKEQEKAKKKLMIFGETLAFGAKKLVDFVMDVAKANDELGFLEKNLGMSATSIKAWQGAAAASGGTADGMTSSMKSLNMAMNDFVVMGDTSMLPYMNALGIAMTDANGKVRDTDKVMLDLADSFSKMDREQAFSIASKMGIDEGTFNTLVQGRKEMEKMIEYQKTIYKSSEKELQVSRDLARNRALLGTHWESMKLMIGNILMPLFLKLSEVLLGMFEYLQAHQREVKAFFTGLAFVIGAILTPILIKATVAALAFIAPFAPFILVVTALGAAFGALYDDYKTWAEGGNSLFDWGAFRKYIDDSTLSTDNLKNAFKNLTKEVLSGAIPTLKGYADIVRMLAEGNFKGAGALATEMLGNLGQNIGDVVDDVTGNKRGSFVDGVSRFLFPDRPTTVTGTGTTKQAIQGGSNALLNLIAKGEVGTTGAAGYNTAYSGARISAKKMFGKDLSQLTIAQVKELQKANINEQKARGLPAKRRSSAMGRYQFIYSGFDDYIKAAGLSDSDLFSPANQDAMAMAILNKGKYGLNAVKSGTATIEQFQDKVLSPRWASIKNSKGKGVHDAAGFNKATHGSTSEVADAIQQTIRQGTSQIPANAKSSNISNKNDVKIGDIKVYTTASSVKGTTTDAMTAVNNQLFQFGVSMT